MKSTAENQVDRVRRVCFVAPDAYPVIAGLNLQVCGGAEIQQKLLSHALVARDVQVHFIVGDFGQSPVEYHDGATIHKVPFRYLGGPKWYYASDTANLLQKLRAIDPDVCLLRNPNALLIALTLDRFFRSSVLVKLVARDLECKPGWSIPELCYRISLRFADAVVLQSPHQHDLCTPTLRRKCQVIPSVAHNPPMGEVRRDIDVLWVGTALPPKRVELALEIARSTPDLKFAFVIAPGPDEAYGRKLAHIAKECTNVDWLGFRTYSETWSWYKRTRVVLHTSAAEGFPNVFLQAWLAGAALVSMKIDPGGILNSKGLGFIAPDVDSACETIRALVRHEEFRSGICDSARHYVTQAHSADAVAMRHMEMWEALCR